MQSNLAPKIVNEDAYKTFCAKALSLTLDPVSTVHDSIKDLFNKKKELKENLANVRVKSDERIKLSQKEVPSGWEPDSSSSDEEEHISVRAARSIGKTAIDDAKDEFYDTHNQCRSFIEATPALDDVKNLADTSFSEFQDAYVNAYPDRVKDNPEYRSIVEERAKEMILESNTKEELEQKINEIFEEPPPAYTPTAGTSTS